LVKVTPNCEVGESVCSNGIECSVDGQCLDDLSTSVNVFGDETTGDGGTVFEPPVLSLVGPEFVRLPRGTVYRKCDPEDTNDVPRDGNFCDQGATATDHDFDNNIVDIDSKVGRAYFGKCCNVSIDAVYVSSGNTCLGD
jgi:hypothetical protein